MADALLTLARLRRLEADEARRELGSAMMQERQAQSSLAAALQDRTREAQGASADAADPLASAYAAWLPASVRATALAREAVMASETASRTAAAALGERKAALEAVGILVAERNRNRRRKAARLAQLRLDEAGQRLAPSGGGQAL
jgi:flagellar biosynthesis chaperone FliJ